VTLILLTLIIYAVGGAWHETIGKMKLFMPLCSAVIALSLVSATDYGSTWSMICYENVTKSVPVIYYLRSVVINTNGGADNQDCLTNRMTECSTLEYVLNNVSSLSEFSCLKVIVKDVFVVQVEHHL